MIGLEHAVLLTIMRFPNVWGTAIAADLNTRGYKTAVSAVYTTLERLAAKKLVAWKVIPPTKTRGGRAKTLFKLNAAGVNAVYDAATRYDRLTEGLNLR